MCKKLSQGYYKGQIFWDERFGQIIHIEFAFSETPNMLAGVWA